MINTRKHLPSSQSEHGIVLLEALIAILIFSIGILGVVGLQAAMIKSTADAKYRAEASYIAQQRIGLIWVDQANLAVYGETDTDIAATSGLPNGKRTTRRADPADPSCVGDLSCFTVIVSWMQPGSTATHNVTVVSRITGGV
jgi:type IV pilus assembly protein PilV